MFNLKIVLTGIIFVSLMAIPCFAPAAETILTVQVKESQMRTTPSFLGKIVTRVFYTERVTLLEDRGAWKRVSKGRAQGWIHASALTARKIVLRSGKTNVRTGVASGELALAGKGFNAQLEAEFRNKNQLDFTQVDRMEKITIRSEQMESFLKEGLIVPPQEGDL
jgi:hypothetical protein